MSIVRDMTLAAEGQKKIDWVKANMPILAALEDEFMRTRPLSGKKVAVSVHLEAKTARLCLLLAGAGAHVAVTGSNPLSTKDDVAAALAANGIDVYAWYGATPDEYTAHLKKTLEFRPDIILDDGGDLVHLLHTELRDLASNIIGGCEETTTGVMRLRARKNDGSLLFPMIALNDADCKHLFDNRFGTGQSTWDGFMRTTNLLIAGKTVVVAGYGQCGRGVCERARGMGANVIIAETDPVKALQAVMEGYRVMPMNEAAALGDIFITVTGCRDVITTRHFEKMKDGALLANAGHFDVEINIKALAAMAVSSYQRRKNIMGYTLKNGHTLNVLAEGRLLNLAAGDGHPAEIMDMSFALQALCICELAAVKLPIGVHDVPEHINLRGARLKLAALGVTIDALTDAQQKYITGYDV